MIRKIGQHLTYEERCQIYAFLKSGMSHRAIAKVLKISHTTVLREVERNAGKKGYRHHQAQRAAVKRRFLASSIPYRLLTTVKKLITKMLRKTQASPEQISGRLKKEGTLISAETIYKWIWQDKKSGGELYQHLRHRGKKYNKRSGKTAGRGLIPNRVDIALRPAEALLKQRFGDLELDTIVGKNHQSALVSVVDRASKFLFLHYVPRATAANIKKVICQALDVFAQKNLIKTLTSDNGKEFAKHQEIAQILRCAHFFARPYCSWERGLNEHTNGLVRQYFPKGFDFTTLTEKQVHNVAVKINNRPRAVLNFQTPKERLLQLCPNLPSGAFRG